MVEVNIEELKKKVGGRYRLAILAAKRARAYKEGEPQLAVCDSKKPAVIALEEIAQGYVLPEDQPLEKGFVEFNQQNYSELQNMKAAKNSYNEEEEEEEEFLVPDEFYLEEQYDEEEEE